MFVIYGLTQLGMEPESTVPEAADVLSTRPRVVNGPTSSGPNPKI